MSGIARKLMGVTKGGLIEFISSSSGAVSSPTTTVTATKPTGTQDGDLLLAFARAGAGTGTITADDAGWTEEIAKTGGSHPSGFRVYSRNASSDPSTYSFTRSGGSISGTFDVVVCLFRGGDNSVDTVGSLSDSSGSTVTSLGLTTTNAGLLVAVFSWNGSPIISSAPSGMLVADTSLDNDGTNGTTVAYYKSIGSGETSDNKVLTLNAGNDWVAAQISIS